MARLSLLTAAALLSTCSLAGGAPIPAWGTTISASAGTFAQALGVAIAPGDTHVFAVGGFNPGQEPSNQLTDPYAEIFDGTKWTATPVPLGSVYTAQQALLWGVYASSPSSAIAVGVVEDANTGPRSETLLFTWDGSAWTRVDAGVNSSLGAIAGCSAQDVWAVGGIGPMSETSRVIQSVDGGSVWKAVPSTNIGPLSAVSCGGNGVLWASSFRSVMRLDRATGAWTTLPAIPVAQGSVAISGIVWAPELSCLWAVGNNVIHAGEGQNFFPYVALWNGSGWTVEDVPGVTGTIGTVFTSVAASSTTTWATTGEGLVVRLRPDGQSTLEVTPGNGAVNQLSAIAVTSAEKPWAAGTIWGSPWRPGFLNSPGIGQGGIAVTTGVSGASVTWIGPVSGYGTTGFNGSFSIGGLLLGDYSITASKDACVNGLANATVSAGIASPVVATVKC